MTARLANQLEKRRIALGMSCATVALRAGLSLRTVQRALGGDDNPEVATIEKIARALDASLTVKITGPSVAESRRRQARRKADLLVSLTQGTSALEAQAVSESRLDELRQRAIEKLLSGSTRRLWA